MKKLMALLLVTMLVLAMLTGCSEQDPQNGTADNTANEGVTEPDQQDTGTKRDSIVSAFSADIGTFDPYIMSQNQEIELARNMFDSLTWLIVGEAKPTMRIAKDYTVSDDGLEYLFTLRDDAYFHNGDPITLGDVLYSIECFRTAPATMSFSAVIESVESVGEDQVLIRLLAPSGSFFESLNWLAIVPKAVHESESSDFANNPVGSGPYMLSSRTPGVQVELKAFDQYYLGQPQIQTAVYKIIPDQSTVAIALETGELDYSKSISFTSIPDLEASGKLNVEIRTGNSVMFVFLNTKQAPYDDPLVRRAINLAIDREMCNIVMYEGYGEVATTMLSPTTFGHNEKLEGFTHQPEEAADLLEQAGYPDGAGFPAVVIETIDSFGRIAEVVQSDLRGVGIQAEIELQEQNAYVTRALQGDVNFGIIGVGLGGDASSWGVMFQTGGAYNFAQYENPELDALFDEAAVLSDADKRKELYDEAFQLIEDEAAWVPLLYTTVPHVAAKEFNISEALRIGDSYPLLFYITVE